MTVATRAALVATVAAALLVAARVGVGRWLASDGLGAPQRPLARGPSTPAPRPGPVRVVVLDGLGRADAGLPALEELCARGLDLTVDVGFPTKSLPVQAVLWTGLTAQQLGWGPSNRARPTPPGALPPLVPGSRAVVEAWGSIARTVGFADVEPPPRADWAAPEAEADVVAAWRAVFVERGVAAAASDAPLVLLHVLAIDRASHERGPRSPAATAARTEAERALARWLAAAPRAHWIVLSDHGHVAGGGHGDAEPALRLVRACVWPRPPGAPDRGAVHLVDLAAHLRAVTGRAAHPGAVGRPLASAVAAPDPDATLPSPRAPARALALTLVLVTLGWVARRPGRRLVLLGLPLGLGLAVALAGVPTLSLRTPPWVALCGALTAAPGLWFTRRAAGAGAGLVALTLAVVAGAACWAELPFALASGAPPARPFSTAWFELVATVAAGTLVAAGAVLSAHPDSPPRRRRPASGRP